MPGRDARLTKSLPAYHGSCCAAASAGSVDSEGIGVAVNRRQRMIRHMDRPTAVPSTRSLLRHDRRDDVSLPAADLADELLGGSALLPRRRLRRSMRRALRRRAAVGLGS